MRDIKFRAWDVKNERMVYEPYFFDVYHYSDENRVNKQTYQFYEDWRDLEDGRAYVCELMQFTGLKDKNGKEIYEGDILEFADKWEWYKTSYGIKMRFAEPERRAELQKQYDAEPMERRVIEIPGDYDWLLSHEIQSWWHVIGNIFENPELTTESLKQAPTPTRSEQ